MKNKILAFAVLFFFLAACSDDSSVSTQNSGGASNIRSSCKFDESVLEDVAANAGVALKKMVYDDSLGRRGPERFFFVETAGDSAVISLTGLADACNRLIRKIDVRLESDTLFATLKYDEHGETDCLCFWVDMSFTVNKKFLGDSVKTLVIGNEIFTRVYQREALANDDNGESD